MILNCFPPSQVEYVHLLNATMCATTRAICVILENYQTEEGVLIPEALKPFMPPGNYMYVQYGTSTPNKEHPLNKGLMEHIHNHFWRSERKHIQVMTIEIRDI